MLTHLIRIAGMLSLCFATTTAFAGDFKWSGSYRFEALTIKNPEVTDKGKTKAYALHHLVLKPEIVAYDGLTIHSRFDIFNNSTLPNHQHGQVFGNGVGGTGTNMDNTNTLSNNQATEMINVNELYANWNHEFGVLTAGRAPIQFGLGMTFNAGHGPFDHFLSNRDMVAYKIVMGNFFVMPAIGKVNEGNLDQADDVNDYIVQAQYENPETELAIGVIYQARRSTKLPNSNDTFLIPGAGTLNQVGGYEVDTYNFFVNQWVDNLKIAFEVGFEKGSMGVDFGSGIVSRDGVGVLAQLDYHPDDNPWGFDVDFGYASGDDPATNQKVEGFYFNRNIDMAFLLFNHPLGEFDILNSKYVRGTSNTPGNLLDTEAITNALFASAGGDYSWSERKFTLGTRLTYAQLNKEPFPATNMDTGLGFELDLSFKYAPFDGFQWITRAGALMPGSAFEQGTNQIDTKLTYGIETKAAISF